MDFTPSLCENKLNFLIGIPFKLNGITIEGCDCRGIVYLYHKIINDKEIPGHDIKMSIFRNKKYDVPIMISTLRTFTTKVLIKNIKAGDIILLKTHKTKGAMGVYIGGKQFLHMHLIVGSCLTKLEYIKHKIFAIYRPTWEN